MITLKHIYKYYDSKFQRTFVLKDINIEIKEDEFVTIMGPSGAGKSTLLNIIGMIDESGEEEYIFLDRSLHSINEKSRVEFHRNYVGFIFLAFHLIEEMRVFENIETLLAYMGVKSSLRKGMVDDMLDRFNIVAKKDLFPVQLSGGQQQLVGIARAIVGKPKLLLADEPTENLIPTRESRLWNYLNNLTMKTLQFYSLRTTKNLHYMVTVS